MNNTLVIAVTTGKGGAEFERECNKFEAHHNALGNFVTVHKLKHDKQWKQYHKVLKIINDYPGTIERLVFFCHGTWKKLKVGFHIWNVVDLANSLASKVNKDTYELQVALYACSCGRSRLEWPWRMTEKEIPMSGMQGKNGFAFRLSAHLNGVKINSTIFAHGSWGHTTRNPYAYKFTHTLYYQSYDVARTQRTPIVQKGTPEWKQWREKLKTSYRFDAPFE